MDNNPYNAPPEARYSMPSQLPPERDSGTAYNLPPAVQQPQQKSVFEQYPFHSYLEDHAANTLKKKPYDLSDDEIKGALGNYLDTVLSNQLSNEKGFANEAHFNAALKARKDYFGPLARARLEQDMPNLRAYLNGLKPQPKPGETQQPVSGQEGFGANLGNALEKSIREVPAYLAGIGEAAPKLPGATLDAILNPGRQLFNQVTGSNIPSIGEATEALPGYQNVKNVLRKAGQENVANVEKDYPQPANDLASRAGAIAGGFPGGIIGQNVATQFYSDLNNGKSEDEAKRNAAVNAAEYLLLSRVPGGGALARMAKGAVLNPAIDIAGRVARGEHIKDMSSIDLLLDAAFGAGFAGVLGRRPGEVNAKGKGEEVPPTSEKQQAPGEAGKPVNEGGAPVAPSKLSPEQTQGVLNNHIDAIESADTSEKANAAWQAIAADVDPAHRPGVLERFNEMLQEAHGDEAPQVGAGEAAPNAEEQALSAAAAGTPDATKGPPVPPSEPPKSPETPSQGAQTPEKPASGPTPEPVDPELQHREEPTIETHPLPRSLGNPKSNFGKIPLSFNSYIDRLLYIVRNSNKLSNKDSGYMEVLKRLIPNKTDAQIRALGEKVKTNAKKAIDDPNNANEEVVEVPNSGTWHDLESERVKNVQQDRARKAQLAAEKAAEGSNVEVAKLNPLSKPRVKVKPRIRVTGEEAPKA